MENPAKFIKHSQILEKSSIQLPVIYLVSGFNIPYTSKKLPTCIKTIVFSPYSS